MNLKILLFPAAAACLMLGMHYAVFKSFMHFFQISRPQVKILLYAAMVILSFSFITAFSLIHWRENFWTIGWYRFAATWTGFGIHCLAAVAAAWILLGAARSAGIGLSAKTVGAAAMGVALLVSIYGTWASFHPKIQRVEVEVKNLPQYWKNSTIVHLSDLHLGHIYKKGFAARVTESVNSLDPDLVLITGDLLDGMGGPYQKNIEPLYSLESKHGVFFVTGNHEHYVGIEKSLGIIEKTPFRLLDNEAVKINGMEIVGVNYPGIEALSNIDNFSADKDTGTIRIAMFHTPTEMGKNTGNMEEQHFANYWMPNTSYELNRKLAADLQISGHTHHGQLFPVNLLTRLLYKGHDYGLKKINGTYLYTSAGTGSWGPPMRTSGRPEIVAIRFVEK
ncbi:MAG: metallophosphoesterase [Desulfobacteraceae bacterium]|nr:metallophosphoesterase [Desulfobacteraceae bacterium]MCF8093958.1 metallophosphoesterase [Desulfobacteraceae bacterium]